MQLPNIVVLLNVSYVCMYDGVNIVCVCREYTLDVYRMASVVTEVSGVLYIPYVHVCTCAL